MAMPPTVTNAAWRRSTLSGTGTTWLIEGAATSAWPLAAYATVWPISSPSTRSPSASTVPAPL